MEVVMVSACLLGENCKYNGGNNGSEKVKKFLEGKKVIPVCPEVLGGLPVPREPAEIVKGRVINRKGISVDQEFRAGAKKGLELARKEQVSCVILQSRSPSCGVKEIYDGSFGGIRISGQGIFAKLMIENGFEVMDVEDL